jgi:prevent-host-death family protein
MGAGRAEIRVGIRELKSDLSRHLRSVQDGMVVIVTDRGRPVARLVPEASGVAERLRELSRAGVVAWSGRRLGPAAPVAVMRAGGSVADLLLEDRE